MTNTFCALFLLAYVRAAYIEFVDKESVINALKLDESVFKNRQLKVSSKNYYSLRCEALS